MNRLTQWNLTLTLVRANSTHSAMIWLARSMLTQVARNGEGSEKAKVLLRMLVVWSRLQLLVREQPAQWGQELYIQKDLSHQLITARWGIFKVIKTRKLWISLTIQLSLSFMKITGMISLILFLITFNYQLIISIQTENRTIMTMIWGISMEAIHLCALLVRLERVRPLHRPLKFHLFIRWEYSVSKITTWWQSRQEEPIPRFPQKESSTFNHYTITGITIRKVWEIWTKSSIILPRKACRGTFRWILNPLKIIRRDIRCK